MCQHTQIKTNLSMQPSWRILGNRSIWGWLLGLFMGVCYKLLSKTTVKKKNILEKENLYKFATILRPCFCPDTWWTSEGTRTLIYFVSSAHLWLNGLISCPLFLNVEVDNTETSRFGVSGNNKKMSFLFIFSFILSSFGSNSFYLFILCPPFSLPIASDSRVLLGGLLN